MGSHILPLLQAKYVAPLNAGSNDPTKPVTAANGGLVVQKGTDVVLTEW